MIYRHNTLHANRESETKLHVLAGCNGDNNFCSKFINNCPTLQLFHKLKGKFLIPFVVARLFTHSKGKIAGTIRKPGDVQVFLNKLIANPGYPIATKEASLLLLVF
jgi:hypothetical protein